MGVVKDWGIYICESFPLRWQVKPGYGWYYLEWEYGVKNKYLRLDLEKLEYLITRREGWNHKGDKECVARWVERKLKECGVLRTKEEEC